MDARIKGEVRVSWQTLLDAVCQHAAEAPVGELSECDAGRLIAAGNDVLVRLMEARDNANGK